MRSLLLPHTLPASELATATTHTTCKNDKVGSSSCKLMVHLGVKLVRKSALCLGKICPCFVVRAIGGIAFTVALNPSPCSLHMGSCAPVPRRNHHPWMVNDSIWPCPKVKDCLCCAMRPVPFLPHHPRLRWSNHRWRQWGEIHPQSMSFGVDSCQMTHGIR